MKARGTGSSGACAPRARQRERFLRVPLARGGSRLPRGDSPPGRTGARAQEQGQHRGRGGGRAGRRLLREGVRRRASDAPAARRHRPAEAQARSGSRGDRHARQERREINQVVDQEGGACGRTAGRLRACARSGGAGRRRRKRSRRAVRSTRSQIISGWGLWSISLTALRLRFLACAAPLTPLLAAGAKTSCRSFGRRRAFLVHKPGDFTAFPAGRGDPRGDPDRGLGFGRGDAAAPPDASDARRTHALAEESPSCRPPAAAVRPVPVGTAAPVLPGGESLEEARSGRRAEGNHAGSASRCARTRGAPRPGRSCAARLHRGGVLKHGI